MFYFEDEAVVLEKPTDFCDLLRLRLIKMCHVRVSILKRFFHRAQTVKMV